MRRPMHGKWLCALGAAACLTVSGGAKAQDANARPAPPKGAIKGAIKEGKIAGVIVKIEDLKDVADARGKRLTVNTAAVWRDWVRDQARVQTRTSTKTAAKDGENSIATRGEPQSENTLVVVDVRP